MNHNGKACMLVQTTNQIPAHSYSTTNQVLAALQPSGRKQASNASLTLKFFLDQMYTREHRLEPTNQR